MMSDTINSFATLAGFDTETTGTNPETARIVEVAVLTQTGANEPVPIVNERLRHDPAVEIPAAATAVHGITTTDLADAPPAIDVIEATRITLADLAERNIPVVIYNAHYDLTILAAELDRYHLDPIPPITVIDPLVLDRHYDRYRKGKRTLTAVAAHYGVPLVDAHGAAADTAASIGVARAIATSYNMPTDRDELHALQATGHATWAQSFTDYLKRIGADREPPSTVWLNPNLVGPV